MKFPKFWKKSPAANLYNNSLNYPHNLLKPNYKLLLINYQPSMKPSLQAKKKMKAQKLLLKLDLNQFYLKSKLWEPLPTKNWVQLKMKLLTKKWPKKSPKIIETDFLLILNPPQPSEITVLKLKKIQKLNIKEDLLTLILL